VTNTVSGDFNVTVMKIHLSGLSNGFEIRDILMGKKLQINLIVKKMKD
jgi:hypothetical protein